jgi:hypothetical protein
MTNADLKPASVPKSGQTSQAPIFHVRTGLRAGVQDQQVGNDAARGFGFAQRAAQFLANWFNG